MTDIYISSTYVTDIYILLTKDYRDGRYPWICYEHNSANFQLKFVAMCLKHSIASYAVEIPYQF